MRIRVDGDVIHLFIIVLAFPIQILLLNLYKNKYEVKQKINVYDDSLILKSYRTVFYSFRFVKDFLFDFYNEQRGYVPEEVDLRNVVPEELKSKGLYFGQSMHPRFKKPSKVKYYVGLIVYDKLNMRKGVVVGWDEFITAPKNWIKTLSRDPEMLKEWLEEPFYRILPSGKEEEYSYVPQSLLIPMHKFRTQEDESVDIENLTDFENDDIDLYFEENDGSQFLPKNWLSEIYPYG